jgi:hypothetical protein
MHKYNGFAGDGNQDVAPTQNIEGIRINSDIEELTADFAVHKNTEIYNLNRPLLNYADLVAEIETHPRRAGISTDPFNYNLDDIGGIGGSGENGDIMNRGNTILNTESHLMTSASLLKSPNKFDELLYNTFLNASVINGEISKCDEYVKKAQYRLNLVFFLNVVCIPFTIPIVLIYFIIKYGERMYSNAGFLFERVVNIRTRKCAIIMNCPIYIRTEFYVFSEI